MIKWQGQRSESFQEDQGIRQGGVSSTSIFKAKTNPSLHRLERHPDCLKVGSIPLGAVMVADDLVLASISPQGIQGLILEAQLDASRERFSFSKTKTKAMKICPTRQREQEPLAVKLYNSTLETSSAETHLGIVRSNEHSNRTTVSNRVKSARRTCYSLMGSGLHGLNGVGPEVGKHLLAIFIIPRLCHGLETLILSGQELATLEDFFRRNLRNIQHLPKSTATPALYLLSGFLPLKALLHIRTLTFFTSTLRRGEQSIEFRLIERQLAMKSGSSSGWVWHVQALLTHYGLPSAFSLLRHQPGKVEWKKMVKSTVTRRWECELKGEARKKKTLSLVNLTACDLRATHPVWRLGAVDQLTVIKATNKAKLLVQRYPIFSNRTSGNNYGSACPLCSVSAETLHHFLTQCEPLRATRRPYMVKLESALTNSDIPFPPDEIGAVKLILDPSHYASDTLLTTLEAITRDLCFALHHKRSVLVGRTSQYRLTCGSNLLQNQSRQHRLPNYKASAFGSSGARET